MIQFMLFLKKTSFKHCFPLEADLKLNVFSILIPWELESFFKSVFVADLLDGRECRKQTRGDMVRPKHCRPGILACIGDHGLTIDGS